MDRGPNVLPLYSELLNSSFTSFRALSNCKHQEDILHLTVALGKSSSEDWWLPVFLKTWEWWKWAGSHQDARPDLGIQGENVNVFLSWDCLTIDLIISDASKKSKSFCCALVCALCHWRMCFSFLIRLCHCSPVVSHYSSKESLSPAAVISALGCLHMQNSVVWPVTHGCHTIGMLWHH